MKTSSALLVLLSYVIACSVIGVIGGDPRRGGKPSATAIADLFVQGKYLEVAVNPSGGLGSRTVLSGRSYTGTAVPAAFHKSSSAGGKMGVVVDDGRDGWAVGSPAKSGDAFLEGYDDVGWHLSWVGNNGLQEFHQMPLSEDDEDSNDEDFSPYRGCIPCKNGYRVDTCDDSVRDCSCNAFTMAPTYYDCPFRKWDMSTTSITKTVDSKNNTRIHYTGVATAKEWKNSGSGELVNTGEEITVYKEMILNYNDTYIIEHVVLVNTGTVSLTNVNLVWSIVPTLEAFPNGNLWPKDPVLDYANHFSTPFQADTNGKTLVKARGRLYNMTVSLGANDALSKGWYGSAQTWRASGTDDIANKVWTSLAQPVTTNEELAENAMALGIKINNLVVGDQQQRSMFWGFTADQIPAGFEALSVPSFTTGMSTGITSKDISTGLTSADISTGVTSGLTSADISTGITSAQISTGVTSGLTSHDISTGVTSRDISTGVTSAIISTGITSKDISTGVTSADISTGITSGITSKDISTGITSHDFSTGVTSADISTGVTSRDISTGITSKDISTGITSKDISTGVTSKDISTGVTSKDISTGITSKDISTGVTSADISTGVTSAHITLVATSQDISTGVTSATPISTGVTSSDISTGVTSSTPISTGVTSEDISTGITTETVTGVATGQVTGSNVTGQATGQATGGEETTGEEATTGEEVTSGEYMTTGEDDITTGKEFPIEITTGVVAPVDISTGVTSNDIIPEISTGITSESVPVPISTGITTKSVPTPISTGITTKIITTGKVSGVAGQTTANDITGVQVTGDSGAIKTTDDEDSATRDRNVKIIASVFGVAGFILLVLCVGGVILAVRRMQREPVV